MILDHFSSPNGDLAQDEHLSNGSKVVVGLKGYEDTLLPMALYTTGICFAYPPGSLKK